MLLYCVPEVKLRCDIQSTVDLRRVVDVDVLVPSTAPESAGNRLEET
jgi:hypothetical protein